jgi:hypothetical protein
MSTADYSDAAAWTLFSSVNVNNLLASQHALDSFPN